jgi:hypothetical protein
VGIRRKQRRRDHVAEPTGTSLKYKKRGRGKPLRPIIIKSGTSSTASFFCRRGLTYKIDVTPNPSDEYYKVLSWKLTKLKVDEIFFIKMSLEQFLTRAPSLHHSIDTKWNIQNAYNLIEYACYTLTVLENDKKKRYTQLYDFLDKKETYLELHKELDVLVNKHNLRECVDNLSDRKDYLEDNAEDDIYYEQNRSHIMYYYKNNLEHADKLVERDLTWKNIYYEYSDEEY